MYAWIPSRDWIATIFCRAFGTKLPKKNLKHLVVNSIDVLLFKGLSIIYHQYD
ncbi:MAG: hypothetical protein RLZZ04_4217 [Cyanobacteriota bacterium]|jgi:hypothetical protein